MRELGFTRGAVWSLASQEQHRGGVKTTPTEPEWEHRGHIHRITTADAQLLQYGKVEDWSVEGPKGMTQRKMFRVPSWGRAEGPQHKNLRNLPPWLSPCAIAGSEGGFA